jgi:hypothetical protein
MSYLLYIGSANPTRYPYVGISPILVEEAKCLNCNQHIKEIKILYYETDELDGHVPLNRVVRHKFQLYPCEHISDFVIFDEHNDQT